MRNSLEGTRASDLRAALKITAIALGVRVLVAITAYRGTDIVVTLWPRGVEALGIARSLLHGQGFSSPFGIPTGPTAFLAPVYPVILAGIENIFGIATRSSAWAILVTQCIFSAVTCVPVYYLARETMGRRVATRAAWTWALFPYAIILPTNIIWESSLSALLLPAGLYFFLRAQTNNSILRWIASGVFWAVAALVNASLLGLLPALLTWQMITNRRDVTRFLWCSLAFMICLAPWTARNYRVFHKLVPVRDNFALELWIGNHEGATTKFTPEIHPAFNHTEVERYQVLGEIGYMAEKKRIALRFIYHNPLLFLENTLKRTATYWLVGIHRLWLLVPFLSILGLSGMAIAFHRSHAFAWIFAVPLLVYPLPYYLTHPDLRYQHPLQPLLSILAVSLVTEILGMNLPRRQKNTAGNP